jgi:Bacterial protein of unknown function (DUF853)
MASRRCRIVERSTQLQIPIEPRAHATLPEVGDLPKPELAFFFDEATAIQHLDVSYVEPINVTYMVGSPPFPG